MERRSPRKTIRADDSEDDLANCGLTKTPDNFVTLYAAARPVLARALGNVADNFETTGNA